MNAQLKVTRSKVTRSQVAKEQNEMGVSLNTSVVHRELSLKFSKLCCALTLDQLRFLRAAFKYVPEGQNASVRKRRLVGSRLDDITKVIRRSEAFVRIGGANQSEQDKDEKDILALFLVERAVPFVEFWRETLTAIAQGASPEIKWRDIPIWFDGFVSSLKGQKEILIEGGEASLP
jgi:hypothetical protein